MSARITLFAALIAATSLSGCVASSGYYDDGYRGPVYNDDYRRPVYDDGYRGPVIVDRVGPGPRRDYYRDRRGPDRDWQRRDRREAERDRQRSDRRERRDDRAERRRDLPERVEERRIEEQRPPRVEQPVWADRSRKGRRADPALECDPAVMKCDGIERLQ